MNRGISIGIVVVVLVGIGALASWLLAQPRESVAAPKPVESPVPVAVAPAPEPESAVAESEPAAPGSEAAAPDEPAAPAMLTEETLKGTTWNSGPMQITLLPDHRIQFGQRIPETARWSVEGARVKLADDKGEVHYFEIEGDRMYFNGSDGKEWLEPVK